MKPNIALLNRQLIDLKKAVTSGMQTRNVKILNPKITYKLEDQYITVKELRNYVIKKMDEGMVGDEIHCRALLVCLNDIEHHYNNQIKLIDNAWSMVAESFKQFVQYQEQLEKEMEEKQIPESKPEFEPEPVKEKTPEDEQSVDEYEADI